MSSFEFVFSLFGLLLGLALAEVLSGFARALKLRRRGRHHAVAVTRLGLATPLLAIFIAIDIAGFWFLAWRARASIPATPAALLVGLVITGLYYLAASFVFPEEPEAGTDLDSHFDLNKRLVLGLVLLCNLLAHGFRLLIVDPASLGFDRAGPVEELVVYFALLALAAAAPRRWLSSLALILLIVVYLSDAIMSILIAPVAA